MLRIAAVSLLVLGLHGCGVGLDPEEIPVSLQGYEEWNKVEPLLGAVGGHGDTYRIMYRNDEARRYTGAGEYPLGSAIVKEIYEVNGDGSAGELLYIATMRRIDEAAAPDLPIRGGWLFTQIDGPVGDTEIHKDLCWDSCHRQAPFQGAWFDHSE